MASSNDPLFPQDPQSYQAICTAANTTLTSSPDDTVVIISQAQNPDGFIITEFFYMPRATSLAGNIYIYESDDNGTTQILVNAVAVAVDTVSATDVPVQVPILDPSGNPYTESNTMKLLAGSALYAGYSQILADGMVVCIRGHSMTAGV